MSFIERMSSYVTEQTVNTISNSAYAIGLYVFNVLNCNIVLIMIDVYKRQVLFSLRIQAAHINWKREKGNNSLITKSKTDPGELSKLS